MVSRRQFLRGGVAGAAGVLLPGGVAVAHHRPGHSGGPPGNGGGGQSSTLGSAVEVDVANNITWSLGFPPDGTIWEVPLTTETVDGATGTYSEVQPGDTLRLESGTRGRLVIENLVGAVGAPITVVDDGDAVNLVGTGDPATIGSGQYASLDIRSGSKHVRVVASAPNRIRCSRSQRGVATRQDEQVEFVEVGGVEIFDTTGNPGVHTNSDLLVNTAAQRGLWFHDLWIHDIVESEGLYIGSSTWNDGTRTNIDGCVVENCLVEDTELDGIQVGSVALDGNLIAGSGTRNAVRGNVVRRCGQFSSASPGTHTKGIVINRGSTRMDLTHNWIEEAGEEGIFDQGYRDGNWIIANNVVIRSGASQVSTEEGDGILVSDGNLGSGGNCHIVHNTILNGTGKGIDPGYTSGTNTIRNNIVLGNTINQIDTLPGSWTAGNNRTTGTVGDVSFVNAAADDYHLDTGSPCVDAGVDLSSIGIADDFDGVSRPQGAGWDQGAYERVA